MIKILSIFCLLIFMWIMLLVIAGHGPNRLQSVITIITLSILAIVFAVIGDKNDSQS